MSFFCTCKLVKQMLVMLLLCAVSAVATADLVGEWNFEEGTGTSTADDSGYGNTGTLYNTSSPWATGKTGSYALELDGSDDYVNCGSDSSLAITSELTIEAWVKPDTRSGYHIIATRGTVAYRFTMANGRIRLLIGKADRSGYNAIATGETSLVSSRWYHLVGTYKDGVAKVYINGTLDGIWTGDDEDIGTYASPLNIGGFSYYDTDYFQGTIDELRIYDNALSESDIKDKYFCGGWRFEEGSGSSITDYSDNNNDGTFYNMTFPWVTGKIGSYALEFDGLDDYVNCGSDNSLAITSELTIQAWAKPDTSSGYHIIATRGTTAYRLATFNGKLRLLIANADRSGYNAIATGITTLDSSKWYHLAGTYKNGVAKVYVNGLLDGSATGTNQDMGTYASPLNIGAFSYYSSYYFDGIIDELQIHSRAFSGWEIRHENLEADLQGSWSFDEGTGGSVADASGNGNTGTLTNMSTVTCWGDGRIGYAVELDGVNDYVNCGSDSSLAITKELTVEAWVKPDTRSNYHIIATRGAYCYRLATVDGKVRLLIGKADRSGYNAIATGTTDLDSSKWYHLVGTYKDGVAKVYVNGSLDGTATGTDQDIGTYVTSLNIGCFSYYSNYYFQGIIDQLNIYSKALSADMIDQRFEDHGGAYGFGCEEQPTGDPIGGGEGYSDILSVTDADYEVDTQAELTTAIAAATSGDMIFIDVGASLDLSGITVPSGVTLVYDASSKTELLDALDDQYTGDKVDIVFIDGSLTIDLTGETNISIPGGITLASDRGYDNGSISDGALIKTDTLATYPLFSIAGQNVRITGLRLQGPCSTKEWTSEALGVRCNYSALEIDNCEITAWNQAAITLGDGGTGADIHHNYIHHCQGNGYGYGISHHFYAGGDGSSSLIEANKFDYMRHCVAGTGNYGNSYEARYNLALENANGSTFDMHGTLDSELNDGIYYGGNDIYIHHNTTKNTTIYAVGIRGMPRNEALIYNNWFAGPRKTVYHSTGHGNMKVYMNLETSNRVLNAGQQ